jgi:zinc protease
MHKRLLPALLAALVTLLGASCATSTDQATVETSSLPEGVTLVETWAGVPGELSVPYSKYELDNGLTVILHEDHSDPMVHIDVSYHVGSAREEAGRSGFAHFFEHMMFEGSENVTEGQYSKLLSDAGGSINGTTNSDRTNYFATIPRNHLEMALWLEADRMGLLLPAVDQEKFEVQRETVKNERGQRIDNVPYGRTSETMMKALYPAGHPYSWPVIGWMQDLDAADLSDLQRFFLRWYLSDLQRFFLRWYGPNNAQLVIGGDIDIDTTLEFVAKYFGPVPRGPETGKMPPSPARIESDRYVTLEDNIHLPAIAMLVPTVSYYHEDEAPLDIAARILGQGQASLLYQRLVQTGRAVNAFVSHPCRELACEMSFIVIQNPASGETLAEMEAAIRETLHEFAERGVNQEDLDMFKARYEAGRIFGMQSVGGKVTGLAFSEMFNGDPKNLLEDLERYDAVTTEDVTRAFRKYIEDQPMVVLSIVPNGRTELAAREPNYTSPEPLSSSDDREDDSPELRSFTDNFDRSVRPRPGHNPIVELPPVSDLKLGNGVRVLAVPNRETPTVTVSAVFEVGQRDEPPGKAGLANLTTALMSEATRQRSAAEFSDALDKIGARVSVGSGTYESAVSLGVLDRHLDEAVALMMERLLEPAFNQEDFDRVKAQIFESLIQARKSGPSLASRATNSVLVGPTHPLSYPNAGLPSTVEGLTLEDVKSFYAKYFPASLKGVLVSTSLPMATVTESLKPLGEFEVKENQRAPLDQQPRQEGRTIYLINKDEAAQTSLRLAHPSLPYDALGTHHRSALMNFPLGGTFDSRINLNLREDKGWTYGSSTGFSGGPELGSFREIEEYVAGGMTEDEYIYLQNAIGQRDALRYETPGAKLGLLSNVLRYGLPLDYRKRQNQLLKETERSALNQLASELIHPHDIAIIMVGDADELMPQLEPLGMEIIQLDEDGFPL